MLFKPFTSTGAILFGLFTIANAHFSLPIPTSIGFDDDLAGIAPCGSFDPTVRTAVTDFPISGGNVDVFTTHSSAVFQFKGALTTNLTNWVSLTPALSQIGLGDFCEPEIPAPKEWEGLSAVLQVTQTAHHGALYQCAAIKFVKALEGKTPVSALCRDSTAATASWIV